MQRSSVDLPEPLPPMIATTSPSRADSETPFSTCNCPNFLCRSSMWMASAAPFCVSAVASEVEAESLTPTVPRTRRAFSALVYP